MTSMINGSGKFIGLLLLLLSFLALVSCGSTTGNQTVGSPFIMSLSPGNQTVTSGTTIHFVVTMSGTDTAVTWSATAAGTVDAGTIDAFGVYTAPDVAANTTVTITATSVANPARSISTTLTVIPLPPSAFTNFSTAGTMPVARYGHTATLLPSGNVLVAGGFGSTVTGTASIPNAEIYNPTVTPPAYGATGAMTTPRAYHTATVLANGQVLITGGVSSLDGASLNTAELYNGTFTPITAKMKMARSHHTATLLNDGKVLIAGGIDDTGSPTDKAELYDPATGTFAPTNPMTAPRAYHTAALLKNGKVLIAGGTSDGASSLNTAEFYFLNSASPTFGNFSATTNSMSAFRAQHAATQLRSGSVLLTGGVAALNGASLNSFDLYSTGISAFVTTSGAMSTARADHTSTLLGDGSVLLTGGIDGTTFFNTADLYSRSGGFSPILKNMSTVRAFHAATPLYNGMVLITGGKNTNGAVGSFVIFK